MDTYRTVERTGAAEIRIKGSRFVSLASAVVSEARVGERVDGLRKVHRDARHHCYAYRIGVTSDIYRSTDDGEPSGTAGLPILQQIESRALTNTLVVVARYFGGTKLGRGGLARAYGEAAALALDAAGTQECVVRLRHVVRFGYDDTARAMHVVDSVGGEIVGSEYSEETELVVEVRASMSRAFRVAFVEHLGGRGEVRLLDSV